MFPSAKLMCRLAAAVVACSLPACEKRVAPPDVKSSPLPPVEGKPFRDGVYRSLDNTVVLTLISPDELELRDGGTTYLCKYSEQPDALRVILTKSGTPQVLYFRVTPLGLESDAGGKFFSRKGLESAAGKSFLAELTSNNMLQVSFAARRMWLDSIVEQPAALRMPGDLALRKDSVKTVSDYLRLLVKRNYVEQNLTERLTSAPGTKGWSEDSPDANKYCVFKIYRVKESDPDNCIFLATRNFTYGKELDATSLPFGDSTFIIVQKGGAKSVYPKSEVKNFSALGLLPGRRNLNDRPFEEPDDTLRQE